MKLLLVAALLVALVIATTAKHPDGMKVTPVGPVPVECVHEGSASSSNSAPLPSPLPSMQLQ